MALTSSLVPLGTPAPDFTLPDVAGTRTRSATSPHQCSWSPSSATTAPTSSTSSWRSDDSSRTDQRRHRRHQQQRRRALPRRRSRAAGRPGRTCWLGLPLPGRYRPDGGEGLSGRSARPDFFVYGPDRTLAYRGAFDASTPGNGEPVTGADLTDAIAPGRRRSSRSPNRTARAWAAASSGCPATNRREPADDSRWRIRRRSRGQRGVRRHTSRTLVCLPGPPRGLAVLTCMDSRINPFDILGIGPGDAKVLRNAGGRVTEDVLRTLVLGAYLLDVDARPGDAAHPLSDGRVDRERDPRHDRR